MDQLLHDENIFRNNNEGVRGPTLTSTYPTQYEYLINFEVAYYLTTEHGLETEIV